MPLLGGAAIQKAVWLIVCLAQLWTVAQNILRERSDREST
jgi:hypothetical protein